MHCIFTQWGRGTQATCSLFCWSRTHIHTVTSQGVAVRVCMESTRDAGYKSWFAIACINSLSKLCSTQNKYKTRFPQACTNTDWGKLTCGPRYNRLSPYASFSINRQKYWMCFVKSEQEIYWAQGGFSLSHFFTTDYS